MEEWRPVVGWEGLYEVSSFGNVRTVAHEVNYIHRGKPVTCKVASKLKKLGVCNTGYLSAALSRNGKTVNVQVHTMVAEAFMPNPNGYKVVNHIDHDGHNNHVENLEWCTWKGNNLHAVYNGYQSQAMPVKCIEENKQFPSLAECDRYYRLSLGTTSKFVMTDRAEPHTGFHFIRIDKYNNEESKSISELNTHRNSDCNIS